MALVWGYKRKFFLATLFFCIVGFFAFLLVKPFFTQEQTCFDGKKNQDEFGVDCGGVCNLYCPFQVVEPIVHWVRVIPIDKDIFTVVAMIENQNIDAVVENVEYQFNLYDKDNVFISRKIGQTFIGVGGKFFIVESGLRAGNRLPSRATLTFNQEPVWQKINKNNNDSLLSVVVRNKNFFISEDGPRMTAEIVNNSVLPISSIEAVAVLYDLDGNVLGASKTYIQDMVGDEIKNIYFSWPGNLNGVVLDYQVYLRKNPFVDIIE